MTNTLALRRVLAGLLLATAALFAIGVAIESGEGHHDESGEEETVLGIELESPALVAGAVVVSVLLAVGVLWRPSRSMFIAVAIISIVFTVADIAEAAHKFEESEAGIGVLAAVVALGHLAAAGIAAHLARQRTFTPAS